MTKSLARAQVDYYSHGNTMEVICDNPGVTLDHSPLASVMAFESLGLTENPQVFLLFLSLPQTLVLSYGSPFSPYGVGFCEAQMLNYILPVSSLFKS